MRPSTTTRFPDLIAAARRGDAEAWRILYEAHASPVLGYLRAQRAPTPEDLLGEVWLQAVRDLDRFDGDSAGFRSWLITNAHHRLLDARRALARRPREVADVINDVDIARWSVDDDPSLQLEAEQQLQRILGDMPERQRTVLYLRFVLDMPQRDVAGVLGISTPAMKMLQMRSLRALEKRLREIDAHDIEDGSRGALPSPPAARLGE
jgi:RNA polymerase sigma-70 factor (ECF subfamily)